MTGLDRLRELADDVTGSVWANTSSIYCKKYGLSVDNNGGSLSDFLRQIADQIEDEQEERPTPKVLDADGVEIRVGDKLYDTETGCGRTVRAINASGTVEFEGCEDRGWFTKFLTHRAPVLAADGRPLREGEMVYSIENGDEFTAIGIDAKSGDVHIRWGYDFEDKTGTIAAKLLTHERPVADSWERLEEDAGKDPCGYFGFDGEEPCGKCPASGKNCEQTMAQDLVRRCRALAERERGER